MDRRQKKTREAVLLAFSQLLSKKSYTSISVQEIIDAADIGRTTFYSHFETKDYLLKELCEELFNHIIDGSKDSCDLIDDSVFLHLLRHLQKNELHILELLKSENNEIFLSFFKGELKRMIVSQFADGLSNRRLLPEDYIINHIASSFTTAVNWWISGGMKEAPETITEYFLKTVEPLI